MKTRKREILIAVSVLFAVSSPSLATLELCGGTYTIDYPVSDVILVCYQTPDTSTIVNVVDKAEITSINSYGGSTINIYEGAEVRGLSAYDNSRVAVSGGRITNLDPSDDSRTTISGGEIANLEVTHDARVTITGGSISEVAAIFESEVTIFGGLIGELLTLEGATAIIIHGSDFAVDGTDVGYTEISSILGGASSQEPHRTLTGSLSNGDPIDTDFIIGGGCKIILVPEPATFLLLGLGGLMLRKAGKREGCS